MGVWDVYGARIAAKGGTKRESTIIREKRRINTHLVDNPSYQECIVDGVDRVCGIINSDNYNEKTIISMPDEDLRHGALVEWMDNKWLIIDRDPNTTMYTKCTMKQCNYFLKWVDLEGNVCGQWAIISDGTKYLTGELEDRDFIATRGDTRLSVVVSRTEETLKLDRTTRFIIDDPECHEHLAYVLTKPLRMGSTYNGDGVFNFVVQEVETTDNDDLELLVADYYKYHPRPSTPDGTGSPNVGNGGSDPQGTRKVWI